MSHIDDLFEPGGDRELDAPEESEYIPLDLDAVEKDLVDVGPEPAPYGSPVAEVLGAVRDLIRELREAREQLAYWQGLEEDTVYASAHGGKQRPDDCALWVHHRDGEAADRSVAAAAGAATAYKRVRTLHPWAELTTEPPF